MARRRAGIYVRISDDKEGRELGVRRQEEDARALAERRGWDVLDVYQDNDLSASSGKTRPSWERLLKDIEAHRIDAVIAYSSSRMYRRVKDLGRLLELTKQNGGVDIATVVSGDLNLNTADGRMLANILASIDQGEAERTGERIARKNVEKASAGKPHHTGQRPYGYRWDSDAHTWRIVPEEAAVIRRIAKDLLHGRSLLSVTRGLNVDGIKTGRGAAWSNRTVKRMMLSPTIAGIRVHERTGTLTNGTWKAILTATQHELLTALFQDPTRPRRGGGPSEKKRVLSGLLVCGRCGAKLYGDGRAGYSCKKGATGGGCGNLRIAAAGFEDHVWLKAVGRMKKLEEAGALSALPAEEDEATEALVEERLGLMHRRDELAGKYAEGVLDERQLTVGTAKIDERVRAIDERLAASIRSRAIPDPGDNAFFVPVPKPDRNFSAMLGPRELLERSELLKALIDRIEVGPASRRGVRFEPDRARIVWRKSGTFRFPQKA
jgi:site-specific DNA recombinase